MDLDALAFLDGGIACWVEAVLEAVLTDGVDDSARAYLDHFKWIMCSWVIVRIYVMMRMGWLVGELVCAFEAWVKPRAQLVVVTLATDVDWVTWKLAGADLELLFEMGFLIVLVAEDLDVTVSVEVLVCLLLQVQVVVWIYFVDLDTAEVYLLVFGAECGKLGTCLAKALPWWDVLAYVL